MARRDDVAVNQFIANAAAEKMASFMTLYSLTAEAAKDKRSDFDNYLRSVPDAPAASGDTAPA